MSKFAILSQKKQRSKQTIGKIYKYGRDFLKFFELKHLYHRRNDVHRNSINISDITQISSNFPKHNRKITIHKSQFIEVV